jgi:hypothetical protein
MCALAGAAADRATAAPFVVLEDDFDSTAEVAAGVTALYTGGVSGECPVCWNLEAVQGYSPANVPAASGYGSTAMGFSGSFLRNANPNGELQPSAVLTLTDLPTHTAVNIGFLLAVIDSWDGGMFGGGHDTFNVSIGDGVSSSVVFSETFDNNVWQQTSHCTDRPLSECQTGQTYAGAGIRGAQLWHSTVVPNFASPGYEDSAYDLTSLAQMQSIAHTASTLVVQWYATSWDDEPVLVGYGWQGGPDESWAIDNLTISLEDSSAPVPEPSTLLLLASGVGLLAKWRRRRTSA